MTSPFGSYFPYLLYGNYPCVGSSSHTSGASYVWFQSQVIERQINIYFFFVLLVPHFHNPHLKLIPLTIGTLINMWNHQGKSAKFRQGPNSNTYSPPKLLLIIIIIITTVRATVYFNMNTNCIILKTTSQLLGWRRQNVNGQLERVKWDLWLNIFIEIDTSRNTIVSKHDNLTQSDENDTDPCHSHHFVLDWRFTKLPHFTVTSIKYVFINVIWIITLFKRIAIFCGTDNILRNNVSPT